MNEKMINELTSEFMAGLREAIDEQNRRRLQAAVDVAVEWGYGSRDALALALQMQEAFDAG